MSPDLHSALNKIFPALEDLRVKILECEQQYSKECDDEILSKKNKKRFELNSIRMDSVRLLYNKVFDLFFYVHKCIEKKVKTNNTLLVPKSEL